MNEEISFGNWLKQRRKGLDLTQDELAGRVGCATSMLQKIEAGRRRPSPEFAGRLAGVLNIELDKRLAFVEFARGSQTLSVYELFRPPCNLPAQSTPFIGREHDVAEVCKRLLRDDTRLVTLVGPPGIGKTRLSLQVAAEVRDRFDDGVFFIPLAPVTDPDLVAPAIGRTLGLKESGRLLPFDHLCDYLRFKLMLLVLDNFEQIVAASPLVATMLTACPLLNLLVTSRMPLRLRAERQYPVPPLTLPDLSWLPPAEELSQYAAIALFADRAEAVRPDFVVTADNGPSIAAICHRLDGLPLAIELISARIKMLQPAELLSRLSGPLLLQSDGLSDIDKRQHTIYNAIEWSYTLLTPGEQSLFLQLGVFVGSWTLEAVESVHRLMGAPSDAPILNLLTSLVDKSLVTQLYSNGETRFTMLETIRVYAQNRLEASGQAEVVRRNHAVYYLSLIEATSPRFHGSVELVNQTEREHDNLRAALGWSLKKGEIGIAYQLAIALAMLWTIHTWHLREGRKWLDRVLAKARGSDLPANAQARLLQEAGVLAYLQSDFIAAYAHHKQALMFARQSKDRAMIAHALHGMSNAAMNQGRFEEVTALLAECLPLARETGEKWLEAMALNNLAEVARLESKFQEAELMFEEGLKLLGELDDKVFTPILLDGLGTLAQYQGNYDRALVIHTWCLTLCREMDDRRIIALTLEKLAGVAAGQNKAERAARLLGAADALRKAIHVPVEPIDRSDYERFVEMTHARLDEKSFMDAWSEGREMGLEQITDYALEEVAA